MNDATRFEFAPQTPALFTIEEFQRLVDLEVVRGADKLELDEGVVVRMSPSQSPHMLRRRTIQRDLDAIFGDGELGWIVFSELSLKLGNATLRDADVGVIKPFGPSRGYADPSAVLLVVEVSFTTLSYDLHRKAQDYARNGIPHYWVVDEEHQLVHVMTRPLEGEYSERRPVAFGDPLPVPETDRTIVIG